MSVKNNDAQPSLEEYRAKRAQDRTPEPFPGGLQRPGQFVVHLHDARRRHWDLRLEVGGVLRSWAVPRGPSLDPTDRRLAVETEPDSVEYLDFEDVIPEGNYGAGPIIVWDRGRWVAREDDQTGEEKLLFDLYGHKLGGRWTLVRTDRQGREWLLIKKPDAWARAGEEARPSDRSVYSGLTVEDLAAGEGPSPAIAALPCRSAVLDGEVVVLGAEGRPDWSILDLGPKETPFRDVVRVARCIRELGEEIDLPVFVKTSGKTGLHVLVGLGRQVRYEQSRMLADLLGALERLSALQGS